MNFNTLLRRRRMFVLLGATTITVFSAHRNWQGRWQLADWETTPTPEDVGADFLAGVLGSYRQSRDFEVNVPVHWFLPPDMLAVAFLGSDQVAQGLVLPFHPDQVQTTTLALYPKAQVWLWVHQSWVSVLKRAAELAQCHSLYVHPRLMLVPVPANPHSRADTWRLVRDGDYGHVFYGDRPLRSVALGKSKVSTDETESATSVAQDAVQARRLQLEIDSVISGWTGSTCDGSIDVSRATHDFGAMLSAPPPAGAAKPGLAAVRALTSSELHDGGLLVGSLAPLAESRIWVGVGLVCVAATVLAAAAYHNYQRAEEIRAEALALTKQLTPDVRRLQEIRQEIRRQDDLLSAAHKGLNTPKVLEAMGRLSESLPPKATLNVFKADEGAIELQVSVVKGVVPPSSWSMGDNPYTDLAADGDALPSLGGASIQTYRATAKASTP